MRIAHVLETPRIGVVEAWETQLRLADLCRQGLIGTVIWLLEHEPTYTTGRHGLRSDLVLDDARLAKTGARFVRLDRGGQMTWHGPGQATAYVIGDLRELTRGSVRDFVSALVEATADAAVALGVTDARPDRERHGVYVEERNLGIIGVRVTGGLSLHGLALNRDPDPKWFMPMTACGAPGVPSTSLHAEGGNPDRGQTDAALVHALAARLRLTDEPARLEELLARGLSPEAALPTK